MDGMLSYLEKVLEAKNIFERQRKNKFTSIRNSKLDIHSADTIKDIVVNTYIIQKQIIILLS